MHIYAKASTIVASERVELGAIAFATRLVHKEILNMPECLARATARDQTSRVSSAANA